MKPTVLLLLAFAMCWPAMPAAADSARGGAGANGFNAHATTIEGPSASTIATTTGSSSGPYPYQYMPVCAGSGVAPTGSCNGNQVTCGQDGLLFEAWAQTPQEQLEQGVGVPTCIEAGEGPPDVPVLTPGRIQEAFERVPLPESQILVNPVGGETLVNFPTILYTQADPFTESVQLLGRTVDFDIEATSFTWRTGDGETVTTDWPGKAYQPDVPLTGSSQSRV